MKLDPNNECDAVRLELLLQCDEETREFAEGSAHVESCTACQLRLSEMAADEPSWRMVRDALVGASFEDKCESCRFRFNRGVVTAR